MPGVAGSIPASPTIINPLLSITYTKKRQAGDASEMLQNKALLGTFGHILGTRESALQTHGLIVL